MKSHPILYKSPPILAANRAKIKEVGTPLPAAIDILACFHYNLGFLLEATTEARTK
jgi:hypothetical protein